MADINERRQFTRREFLELTLGLGAAGAASLACDLTTRTVPATLRPLPTQTPDVRPALPNTAPKEHMIVPELSIVTHKAYFMDVTDNLDPEKKAATLKYIENRQTGKSDPLNRAAFLSYTASDLRSLDPMYVSKDMGSRFIAGFGRTGRDNEILRREIDVFTGVSSNVSVSRFGVVAYLASQRVEFASVIVADIYKGEKTVIQDRKDQKKSFVFEVSDDGGTMVLHPFLPRDTARQGIYVIDIKNWSLKNRLPVPALNENSGSFYTVHINEDGSKIFVAADTLSPRIIEVATGKETPIYWQTHLGVYANEAVISPNFDNLAAIVGMFPSNTTEPGQWGILVQGPKGSGIISSPKRITSFIPRAILDDGTVFTLLYKFVPDKEGKYPEAIRLDDGKHIPMSEF